MDTETTLIYTHLKNFEIDNYNVKVSKSLEKFKELLDAGFIFVSERDGLKIYKKPK